MFLNYEYVIIFDMEVIEFNLESKNLLQFSARKYNYNKLIDKIDILISDNINELNEVFTQRTRITKGLLERKGITLEEAKTRITSFIGNDPLVTYKGNLFYFAFLWKFLGLDLEHKHIDIIDICEHLNIVGNPDNVNLKDLANYFKIDFNEKKWHNSSYDVIVLSHLWFKLKSLINKENKNEK